MLSYAQWDMQIDDGREALLKKVTEGALECVKLGLGVVFCAAVSQTAQMLRLSSHGGHLMEASLYCCAHADLMSASLPRAQVTAALAEIRRVIDLNGSGAMTVGPDSGSDSEADPVATVADGGVETAMQQ